MQSTFHDNAVSGIQAVLFAARDEDYWRFQASLMPTVNPETIIGVRVPVVRALAKKLSGTKEAAAFLKALPHRYYEENNLHAFLIERLREFDVALSAVERFLPFVDNWATCDSMNPAVFGRNLPALLSRIPNWLQDGRTYTVRFGVGMLMRYFLDDAFQTEQAEQVCALSPGDYYVDMMVAWYFATALAKQYDAVLPFLTEERLAVWTHNKTIQKAVESRRIPAEHKEFLRSLRRKP